MTRARLPHVIHCSGSMAGADRIGIAGVSCVPSTAKVVQKEVSKVNPNAMVLQEALGANIMGVITTAIITGIFITLIPYFMK